MKKIGLLSDTHGSLPEKVFDFFKDCNEIWHAGDIGTPAIIDKLETIAPVKAVYGNIDGAAIRIRTKETSLETIEGVKIAMIHIGGYPGRYEKKALNLIKKEQPDVFISGHSHILKVMYDKKHDLLHINPGAAGKFGIHQKITMIRFDCDKAKIKNLEIFEIDRRNRLS